MTTIKKLLAGFACGATAAAALSFASPANAATCTFSETLLEGAAAIQTAGVSAATDCGDFSAGVPGGNTKLAQMIANEAFGIDNWTFEEELEVPAKLTGEFFEIEIGSTSGATWGYWRLLPGFEFVAGEDYAIQLKASTTSFVYLLDTSLSYGTWSMFDIKNRNGDFRSLSNIRLFGTAAPGTPEQPNPIPLPAAGWLLLGGLGGLGFLGRRRNKLPA